MSNYELHENNVVTVCGKIASPFKFSHEVFGERFFITNVSIERASGVEDIIPAIISERLVDVSNDHTGEYVEIHGQFRSHNCHKEGCRHLFLAVFIREILFVGDVNEQYPLNQIFLDGYICKSPVYRKTPMGREIADVLLAVNRPYGKSDYIPCICWGRDARYIGDLDVGEHIAVYGRIQSRLYTKKFPDGSTKERTVYEVSVSTLEVIEE